MAKEEKKPTPQEPQAQCPYCKKKGAIERLASHISACEMNPANNPNLPQQQALSGPTMPKPKDNPNFPFVDYKLLQLVGGSLDGVVISVRKGSGKFGEGWNLDISCQKAVYTKSVKQDSANYKRLHEQLGDNWVGKRVQMRFGNPHANEKEQVVIEAYGATPPVVQEEAGTF